MNFTQKLKLNSKNLAQEPLQLINKLIFLYFKTLQKIYKFHKDQFSHKYQINLNLGKTGLAQINNWKGHLTANNLYIIKSI